MKGKTVCSKEVKEIICETPRTNVLQAAEQREPSVKVVAQLAAMTEEAINKSDAITIGNWWNQSGPSAQPKTKSRVAQKQAGRRWSAAEEQAAKRTNEESPPGGGGHVASNNAGAGMVLYNCFTCHFYVAPNAQTPSMKLKVRWASAGLKYGPLVFYGFVRGMYGVCTGYVRGSTGYVRGMYLRVCTGYVRGMYGFGSVVRSVVRTGSTPYQART
jgi:hypothetical protein